ncbi:hypothetical protein AN958_07260 [Leucoagaricus sp. SymC.cos]|nr:hypothetical protein AN958_07260 [Leucoagaricus sp. SymC.cos]
MSSWAIIVVCAVHVYNRTPVRHLNWKTPIETASGQKPNVSYLKVFGCGTYVFIPKEMHKNKLSTQSELMIFLRYEHGSKAYHFMRHTHNNSIFVSPTALFDEEWFPCCARKFYRDLKEAPPPPPVPSTPSGDDVVSEDPMDLPQRLRPSQPSRLQCLPTPAPAPASPSCPMPGLPPPPAPSTAPSPSASLPCRPSDAPSQSFCETTPLSYGTLHRSRSPSLICDSPMQQLCTPDWYPQTSPWTEPETRMDDEPSPTYDKYGNPIKPFTIRIPGGHMPSHPQTYAPRSSPDPEESCRSA